MEENPTAGPQRPSECAVCPGAGMDDHASSLKPADEPRTDRPVELRAGHRVNRPVRVSQCAGPDDPVAPMDRHVEHWTGVPRAKLVPQWIERRQRMPMPGQLRQYLADESAMTPHGRGMVDPVRRPENGPTRRGVAEGALFLPESDPEGPHPPMKGRIGQSPQPSSPRRVPVPNQPNSPYAVRMHLIQSPIASLGAPPRGWMLGLALAATLLGGSVSTAFALDPVTPEPVQRIASTGIPEWTPVEQRVFLRHPGTRWTLYLEETRSGTAIAGNRETPIRQTRIRIALQRPDKGDEVDIGYLQHISNIEVAVLEPGDPRLDEPPVVNLDPENPWPNPAGWSFVDTHASVDLDDDDQNDLFLRYYATISDPRAAGILPISADEFGTPRIMDLSEFVSPVRTDGLHLTGLDWPDPRMFDPIFRAVFLPAEGCRFLAQLGIRGALECDHCCALPIYLRRTANDPEDRMFHPFFDREKQGGDVLDRVRKDIGLVSGGEQGTDLTAAEQAALARAAFFFYYSGSGVQSRLNLEKALGDRASDYKNELFLDKVEAYFLGRD